MEAKNIKNEIIKGLELLKSKILNLFTIFSKRNNKTDSLSDEKKEIIIQAINQSQKKYEKEAKDEEEKFKKEKDNIIRQKNEEIKKIENNTKKEIEKENKKHKDLLSYLDSIKNDRDKLIEFLQNKNYF
jgi:hypothetical protein